jgi:hypothetical protein
MKKILGAIILLSIVPLLFLLVGNFWLGVLLEGIFIVVGFVIVLGVYLLS